MTSGHRDRLREIKTFPSLVKYLRDDLDWPIESESFEDLTFDYEPDELGIDLHTAAKIESIKQLRPLTTNQPWGIFFVKFQPKRLPVVALRRILGRLVLRKRESANKSERAAWNLHDLLFISAYGEGDDRQISLAHFSEDPDHAGDLPTLKVLGWDGGDTGLHLDHVHDELTHKLRWPTNGNDAGDWREQWSSAFTERHREVIKTSAELAVRLADLARAIRRKVNSALAVESERGPLRKLLKAFQESLIHDLDDDGFADMYAQTIAYGLLSARVSRPAGLVADDVVQMAPVTSPFLRELMDTFLHAGGRKKRGTTNGGLDFDELGVNDVVEVLRRANMPAVLRDFDNRNPQEDPVIHFYELFLKEYDAKKRMQRGVFYTPKPVVSYIVRSVHELLQREFGLEDGLASTVTWGEMAARFPPQVGQGERSSLPLPSAGEGRGEGPSLPLPPVGEGRGEGKQSRSQPVFNIPDGVAPDSPFVQILDPATGTATFLVEVIDVIYRTMIDRWTRQGLNADQQQAAWNDYVPKQLLPRLYGYELMMAPYAIAHMKIGLKLFETGYRFRMDERVRVYLTNALEPPSPALQQTTFADWFPALAHEAQAVNAIKRDQRFTVVIGNPPYSGISSNRNGWIEGLLKGETSTNGTNYYEVDGKSLGEKKIWLQDDYVKFIRLSQYFLEQSSLGVHGMITNHSYLDSPTCRGMRFQLRHFFSALNVLDLHGSTKKGEVPPNCIVDENVFDILPGVAIAIAVAAKQGPHAEGAVQSYDLWGTRSFKFHWLLTHEVGNTDWSDPNPRAPYYLFAERQLDHQAEYHEFLSLKEIFPFYGTGIQTSRDDFSTDLSRPDLEDRLRRFFDRTASDKQVAEAFGLSDTRGWKIKDVRRSASFESVRKSIVPFLFRAFDHKWIALTKDLVDWPRLDVMSCVSSERIGLLCSRQQAVPGFRHALVVNVPVDMFCLSNKSREGQTLFPLFAADAGGLFRSSGGASWRINFSTKAMRVFETILSRANSPQRRHELTQSDVRQAFDYVYAILHSPSYRRRYSDLLKMDYPRLPIDTQVELFCDLARRGGELVALHLMESPKLANLMTEYTGPKNPEVGRVGWSDDTVWLDAAATKKGQPATPGTVGFRGVPEAVWNFHIGSYQVCQKWLKDRKGRTLSKDDIAHYQKIVVALHETIRLMREIDEVIDQHGGWPGAFVTGAPATVEPTAADESPPFA